MLMPITQRSALALAAALLTACAGSGEDLDENGRPIGENPSTADPPSADFASIQNEVFTPLCTGCHAGALAPLGLRLDEASSYAMLVDVPSVEVPQLLRVERGDPDNSYLVQKIEGSAAVGGRMPLFGPPLPASAIALIRQWIADGAPPPAGASPAELFLSADDSEASSEEEGRP